MSAQQPLPAEQTGVRAYYPRFGYDLTEAFGRAYEVVSGLFDLATAAYPDPSDPDYPEQMNEAELFLADPGTDGGRVTDNHDGHGCDGHSGLQDEDCEACREARHYDCRRCFPLAGSEQVQTLAHGAVEVGIDTHLDGLEPATPEGGFLSAVPSIRVEVSGHTVLFLTWDEARAVAAALERVTNLAHHG